MNEATITPEQRTHITRKVTLVGAVLNIVLTLAKVMIGYLAQSQALIADGLHSLSDLLSDVLVLVAANHSQRGPDSLHPYGHGRYETAATLGLSLILLAVAVAIGWDAMDRLFHPETLLVPGILAFGVAAASVIIKEGLYHYTIHAARRIRSDLMRANAWHHRSDSISSVVVILGLLGTYAGLNYFDAIAALGVAVMIAHISGSLGWTAIQELVDAGLDETQVQTIQHAILSVGGVRDIHMLRTRRSGGTASADVHVQVDPKLSVSEGHLISVQVERVLKHAIEQLTDVTVHIDPENDEVPPRSSLPGRNQALEQLETLWRGLPGVRERQQLDLHYLSGRLEIGVHFPLRLYQENPAAFLSMAQEMRARLQGLEHFGTVDIYLDLPTGSISS